MIMAVDYFTKWAEAMPIHSNNTNATTVFVFNHIIARFGIPKSIMTDHESNFVIQ